MVLSLDPECFPNFECFFFVQSEADIEIILELRDQLERTLDVIGRALFWIRQIEEKLAARTPEPRTEFTQQGLPNLTHERNHRPVNKRDQIRLLEFRFQQSEAKTALNIRPSDLIELSRFAQHDFAIFEFEGIRVARFSDGMHFGAFAQIGEDRMQGWDIRRCRGK